MVLHLKNCSVGVGVEGVGPARPSQAPGSGPLQSSPSAEPIFPTSARSSFAVPAVLTGVPRSVNTCSHVDTTLERFTSLWNTNTPLGEWIWVKG